MIDECDTCENKSKNSVMNSLKERRLRNGYLEVDKVREGGRWFGIIFPIVQTLPRGWLRRKMRDGFLGLVL
jgi:hypothetical protein